MQVAGISGIELICDGNKTDVVGIKILLDIVAGINRIAAKSGKVFDNDTVDMPSFYIRKHLLKAYPVKVRTGRAIVDICVIHNELWLICQKVI